MVISTARHEIVSLRPSGTFPTAVHAASDHDGLKGLSSLQKLRLNGCTRIPLTALRELAAALPHTSITFPEGVTITQP